MRLNVKFTMVWENPVEAASVPVRSRCAQLCCPDHEGVDSRPLGGSTGAHVRTFGAPPLSVCPVHTSSSSNAPWGLLWRTVHSHCRAGITLIRQPAEIAPGAVDKVGSGRTGALRKGEAFPLRSQRTQCWRGI